MDQKQDFITATNHRTARKPRTPTRLNAWTTILSISTKKKTQQQDHRPDSQLKGLRCLRRGWNDRARTGPQYTTMSTTNALRISTNGAISTNLVMSSRLDQNIELGHIVEVGQGHFNDETINVLTAIYKA
jgi:hypothetical protein